MHIDNHQADGFFDRVYKVVRQIPYGRVTSYGAIARYLGSGKSARMVGWAMHTSFKIVPPVPAHRVVNRNGVLTGKNHFPTPSLMEELLENEGIIVRDKQIMEFNTVFWDPMIELENAE